MTTAAAEFKQYRKKALGEARPYVPGEDLTGITVSDVDVAKGSPKEGDMIMRQPHDHTDQWLIEGEQFKTTYDPVE